MWSIGYCSHSRHQQITMGAILNQFPLIMCVNSCQYSYPQNRNIKQCLKTFLQLKIKSNKRLQHLRCTLISVQCMFNAFSAFFYCEVKVIESHGWWIYQRIRRFRRTSSHERAAGWHHGRCRGHVITSNILRSYSLKCRTVKLCGVFPRTHWNNPLNWIVPRRTLCRCLRIKRAHAVLIDNYSFIS